jgi:hypothetical protein
MGIMPGGGEVEAVEEPLDPGTIAHAEDSEETFWEKLTGFFEKIVNGMIDFLMAPLEAIGDIFNNWADTLSEWYSPVLMGIVVISLMVMYRLYAYLDDFLDGWT